MKDSSTSCEIPPLRREREVAALFDMMSSSRSVVVRKRGGPAFLLGFARLPPRCLRLPFRQRHTLSSTLKYSLPAPPSAYHPPTPCDVQLRRRERPICRCRVGPRQEGQSLELGASPCRPALTLLQFKALVHQKDQTRQVLAEKSLLTAAAAASSSASTYHPPSSKRQRTTTGRKQNNNLQNEQQARACATFICAFPFPDVDLFAEEEHFQHDTEKLDGIAGETVAQRNERRAINDSRSHAREIREGYQTLMGTSDLKSLKSTISNGMYDGRHNLKELALNKAYLLWTSASIDGTEWHRPRRPHSAAIKAANVLKEFLHASINGDPKAPRGKFLNKRLLEVST
ncbi:hypothetical protein P7C70_g6970, partial [Phenoliferia sp. Uapishka_3]